MPLIRNAVFALLMGLMATTNAVAATTHYIAANGSDSNSGTSQSAPWLHAPGMPNCTASCASYTPVAGDQFIFRGGDTWHFGAGAPLVGGRWNWTWSGSSGSPIYIGVDKTWFSGASWTRPILNGDNPTSTNFVPSCAHDYSSSSVLVNLSVNYLTFDNFEFTGVCWSGQIVDNGMLNQDGGSTNDTIENFFCHGWTMTSAAFDNFVCILNNGGGTLADHNVYAYDVFDGSDSPHFPANSPNCQWIANWPCASGQAIYGRAYDVHNCVFRYLSDFMVTNTTHTVHDNLFEYLYYSPAPGDQQHPNVINNLGGPSGDPLYFYNNVIRHTFVTEDVYLAVRTDAYIFNNVFYDNMNSQYGSLSGGCFRINAAPGAAASQTVYIYNNTMGDASCQFIFAAPNAPLAGFHGTGNFEGNHLIGFSPAALSGLYSINGGVSATIVDNGGEIFQTTAAANAQGFTSANNYAPTLASNSTVGVAANLTSSCSAFSFDSALCSGTSGAVAEQSGSGGQIAKYPAIPTVGRPPSGAWDAGAYEFGSVGIGRPNPPTSVTVVVH
ncbi:MAG: hypothetical protein ACYDD2_01445 [Candidatus Acidiferrales bacterium]